MECQFFYNPFGEEDEGIGSMILGLIFVGAVNEI